MSKKQRRSTRQQFGVVPYRVSGDGRIEVLLITTRENRRWMVPRGWPIKKLGPLGTGVREALEEAGVVGEGGAPVGAFDYLKRLRSGGTEHVRVDLFAMKVIEEVQDWPERAERERRWLDCETAAELVDEAGLRAVLVEFPERMAGSSV